MKRTSIHSLNGLTLLAAAAVLVTTHTTSAHTLILTVNSADNTRTSDDTLTFVEAVAYLNDEIATVSGDPREKSATSEKAADPFRAFPRDPSP